MKLKPFIQQCHQTDVFKMLSIYVVSAWVILQVLSIIWQPLGLPSGSVAFLIIILLLLFPIYIFLLWKIRILPLQLTENLSTTDPLEHPIIQRKAFRNFYFSILGIITILCLFSAYLIAHNNFSPSKIDTASVEIQNDKIAILKFGNNTGSPQYDVVGKMASDWIIHGITQNNVGHVITQDLIDTYKVALKGKIKNENENTIIKEYLRPGKIISGNFYLKNGNLLFQALVIDGQTGKTLFSFDPTECKPENPLKCIDELNESITGYFITADKKHLMLQENPPKYDAYKFLLEAKNTDDTDEYLLFLNKSILADSNYFEPKVLRVAHYYNAGRYEKADSLLNLIKPESYTNNRQLNLLNMYGALLKGDNRKVYKSVLKEYEIAPFDLITNKTAMVIALQFVNRPQDVPEIYTAIPMESLSLQNCEYCVQRIYVMAYANIELKKYNQAIALIENAQEEAEAKLMNRPLVTAYIRAGKVKALEQLLHKLNLMATPAEVQELYLQAGKEFILKNDRQKANEYFNIIINAEGETVKPQILAEAFFYKEDYANAAKIFKEIQVEDSNNAEELALLAICNFKLGNIVEAETNINSLENRRDAFQFGKVDYALAQYYGATQNETELYKHLLKAAASGHLYHWKFFKNDPLFKDYSNSEAFKEVMDFWK